MLLAKYIHINMDKNKRPKLYALPDALPTLQHRRRYDLPGAVCLVSSADRCSVFSVRVCVSCLVCGLSCIWPGLPCCLSCAVVPGALEWAGVHRRGI